LFSANSAAPRENAMRFASSLTKRKIKRKEKELVDQMM
jgi:hypothetical protein